MLISLVKNEPSRRENWQLQCFRHSAASFFRQTKWPLLENTFCACCLVSICADKSYGYIVEQQPIGKKLFERFCSHKKDLKRAVEFLDSSVGLPHRSSVSKCSSSMPQACCRSLFRLLLYELKWLTCLVKC